MQLSADEHFSPKQTPKKNDWKLLAGDFALDPQKCVDIKKLTDVKPLSEGSFGMVTQAKFMSVPVAVKQLHSEESKLEFAHEYWIHSALSHPCIIPILAHTEEPLGIVLKLAPHGSLYDHLSDLTRDMPKSLMLTIAKNLASAVHYLHSREPKIVHRDIKSLNCLLISLNPSSICAQLADFGTARVVSTKCGGRNAELLNPSWLAPEVLKNGQFDESADIYALGMVVWEMMERRLPFSSYEVSRSRFLRDFEDQILKGLRPKIPHNYEDATLADIVCSCWESQPHLRPSAKELVSLFTFLVRNETRKKSSEGALEVKEPQSAKEEEEDAIILLKEIREQQLAEDFELDELETIEEEF